VGSNPTPCTKQEHTNFQEFLLSKTNLTFETVNRRAKAIKQLSSKVDLFETDKVVKFLNQSSWKNGTRNIVVQAYHDYQRMYNLSPVPIEKYNVVQQLPFVPTETELDQLISAFSLKPCVYLSLLKETGIRLIEAWSLEWTDFDTVQRTVNIRTVKHGVPRLLPIPERMINLVFSIRKKEKKYVFAVSEDVSRLNKELTHFTRNYIDRRRMIADNLKNPRIKQISLYTFRHWKATAEYLKTRDIFHVKWLLGHSRIENTMKYVHIANAVSVEHGSFTCKVAHTLEECSQLIESGFEYVIEMGGMKIFRRRK
jgi:integrase